MRKAILFLWGLICILFIVSCTKEQLKPTTGNGNQSVAPAQTVVNGYTIPVPPKVPDPRPSVIIQKGRGHTGLNGMSQLSPTPPPQP